MTQNKKPDKDRFKEWQKDPSNWKLGIFYYNPDDKRLFPPKRFGIGWTINFANPYSVIALLLIIIIPLLVGLVLNFAQQNHN